MHKQHTDYQVLPYAKLRRFSAAAFRSVQRKPMIHGLLAVDVTRARALLREHKAKTGESLSFTAFLMACLAQAVAEHKAVQAIRQGRKRLVIFDDVDVYLPFEREVAGEQQVVPYVIRAANRKSFRAIHDEIRATQVADVEHLLPESHFLPAALFGPFTWLFWRLGRARPRLVKQGVGTVGITTVGMFGTGPGWGIPIPAPTPLLLTVGGIGEQQVVVDGHSEVREYLSLTISVDHDIVDGAPAARFARRLKELIESGYELDNLVVEPERERASEEASYVYNP